MVKLDNDDIVNARNKFVPDATHPGRTVLELSICLSDNPRTRPIIEGRVPVEGIRLVPTVVYPSEIFWRQLRYADFDVSEMSLSTLTIATAQGMKDWVGIPIYTMRKFFHTEIIVRRDSGIEKPSDLKGKRVGVPEYQQTAAIWTRGVLEHEFGVHARDMEWFMERGADKSHGASTGFTPPPGVKLNGTRPDTNLGDMLVKGEIDAIVHYIANDNLVDRSRRNLHAEPSLKMLFDPMAESKRYYEKTGIFPINHCFVVRRSLYERHSWIVLNLYGAFVKAHEQVKAAAQPWLAVHEQCGMLDANAKRALNTDVMPYGIKAARPVLEIVTQYVHEQGLCQRKVAVEELFAPTTLEL